MYSSCFFSDFRADMCFRQRWWESQKVWGGKRSQSHCVQTSVGFVQCLRYSARVSSARWTGSSLKTHWWLFLSSILLCLFHSLSTFRPLPRHTLLSTPCSLQARLLCSCSFTHLLTAHPFDLFLCYCVFYMLPLSFVLCILSLKIETSAWGCVVSPAHMCVLRERRGKEGGCGVN